MRSGERCRTCGRLPWWEEEKRQQAANSSEIPNGSPQGAAVVEAARAEIEAERRRQVEVEGWTPEHDDQHDDGELLWAAKVYLWWGTDKAPPLRSDGVTPMGWPWEPQWWKPKDRRRNIIRAGALCLAEKERLIRRGRHPGPAEHKLDLAIRELAALQPEQADGGRPCPVCGNEERGQGGYLSCECPAPLTEAEASRLRADGGRS